MQGSRNSVTPSTPSTPATPATPSAHKQASRAGKSSPVLSVRGATKRYGAVQALAGADIDVHAGEVVALVGDNGAGKSTLVKVISGAIVADTGTITFAGEDVRIGRPQDAQDLGITTVFQDLALCENLDVVANLHLGSEARSYGILGEIRMERRARDLLTSLDVRIKDVRTPVASLSGGQRQSVAIARALLGDPKLVILDEPTAALGVEQTAQVLALIGRLRERGLGVILISHNLADVRAVSDRVVVLRLGSNAGDFVTAEASQDDIVGAITGARTAVGGRT